MTQTLDDLQNTQKKTQNACKSPEPVKLSHLIYSLKEIYIQKSRAQTLQPMFIWFEMYTHI